MRYLSRKNSSYTALILAYTGLIFCLYLLMLKKLSRNTYHFYHPVRKGQNLTYKKIVGCAHSGWKGALGGIVKNTIKKFNELKSNNNDLIAVVGPCIGKKSYEVGNEFVNLFIKEKRENLNFFSKKNDKKFYFDLRGYVNNILGKCDISEIENIDMNTFEDSENFFSFRRSTIKGDIDYGRCISVIVINSLN